MKLTSLFCAQPTIDSSGFDNMLADEATTRAAKYWWNGNWEIKGALRKGYFSIPFS
jgi:hypothetical protein